MLRILFVSYVSCLPLGYYLVHCSAMVTCWERADILALLCAVFSCISVTFPHVSWSITEIRVSLVPLNMFKPSRNWFTDHSKRCFFCGSFICYFAFIFICYAVLSVSCSPAIYCWKMTDLFALSCVMFSCVFVTYQYGVPSQVWYLITSIPDLAYFLICTKLYISMFTIWQ